MLLIIGYLSAFSFAVLVGVSNWLFADVIATSTESLWFWRAVAVASTAYSAAGWSLLAAQLRRRDYARSIAVGLCLASALGYDVIASYGLSRAEQQRASIVSDKAAHTLAAATADVANTQRKLAAYADAGSTQEAEAAHKLASSRVTMLQCAEVTGTNALKTADATRIRAACAALEVASVAYARAVSRDRLEAYLIVQRERLANAAPPALTDARVELLGSAAPWLPVLLLSIGATLGLYSTEHSTKVHPVVLPKPELTAPKLVVSDSVPVQKAAVTHDDVLTKLGRIKPEADGWIRASQRRLADLMGMSAPQVGRALRDKARDGAIELDTSKGTAIRIK
jgi:hypothetical protein